MDGMSFDQDADYQVINKNLCSEAIRVLDSTDQDEDNKLNVDKLTKIGKECIEFSKAQWLSFSFKKIHIISNLEGFENLQILQLDNNKISKIQNLSHLKNLIKLDLSFNFIRKIEGLEGLSNLQELSLFANQIETLENLDSLTNLRCLSIANNNIKKTGVQDKIINEVLYLRQFKKLGLLTIYGNPICEDPDFLKQIQVFLPIQFLNSRLITEKEKQNAQDEYTKQINEMQLKDQKDKEELEKKLAEEKEEEILTAANLAGVNSLYKKIQNANYQKIISTFNFQEEEEKFSKEFGALVSDFKTKMFHQKDKKTNEIEDLRDAMQESIDQRVEDAKKKIVNFEKRFKEVSKEHARFAYNGDYRIKLLKILEDLELNLNELVEGIIRDEVDQSDAFNDILSTFKADYSQLNSTNIISQFFQDIQDKDKSHFDSLNQQLNELIQKGQANELIKSEFGDKDALLTLLEDLKEKRANILSGEEKKMVDNEQNEIDGTKKLVIDEEYERNRKKFTEILTYKFKMQGDILMMKKVLEEEEDQ